jgi:DNA-binding transcriptional LysR family regulator
LLKYYLACDAWTNRASFTMLSASYRYFLAVAQEGSLRKAAERVHVSQSAISRQITILEDNFGISLLERHARGAVLTGAGELLFDHILRLVNNEQALKVELLSLKGLDHGHVRISCGSGFADDLVQYVLPAFAEAHPAMTYSVMVAGSDIIVRSLLDENADIGLHLATSQHPKLQMVASENWPLHVIMPLGHPLCEQDPVDAVSLAKFPLALPPATHRVRQLVSDIAVSEGIQLNPLMECNSYSALKGFVVSGLGLSVMSVYAAASEIATGKVTTRPLKNAVMSETTASLVVRKGRILSLAAKEFIKITLSRHPAFKSVVD